jgi:Arc/MetJ-type ribon-helix-helix transcriptional regulator
MSTWGHVDLMVKDGFYSNRTDFIRTAIRNQLERHADVVKQSTARNYFSRRPRHHRASRQRRPSCRTSHRSEKDAKEGASRENSGRAWVYPHDSHRRRTQAGQLTEATALLQRMLRGERPLAEAAAAKGLIRLPGRTPTIDLKANGVGNADRAAPQTPAATARRHRPLFDRAKDGTWLGLRGAKHAPASVTGIAPVGTKFIEGTYSNKA